MLFMYYIYHPLITSPVDLRKYSTFPHTVFLWIFCHHKSANTWMNSSICNISYFTTFSSSSILPHTLLPQNLLPKQTQMHNETLWKCPSFATSPELIIPTAWSCHLPHRWLSQIYLFITLYNKIPISFIAWQSMQCSFLLSQGTEVTLITGAFPFKKGLSHCALGNVSNSAIL